MWKSFSDQDAQKLKLTKIKKWFFENITTIGGFIILGALIILINVNLMSFCYLIMFQSKQNQKLDSICNYLKHVNINDGKINEVWPMESSNSNINNSSKKQKKKKGIFFFSKLGEYYDNVMGWIFGKKD